MSDFINTVSKTAFPVATKAAEYAEKTHPEETKNFKETVSKAVFPVATEVVDYTKKLQAETKDVPKRETSTAAKYLFPLPALIYENQDKLEAAGKIIGEDIKDNLAESKENFENMPGWQRFLSGGLIGYIIGK